MRSLLRENLRHIAVLVLSLVNVVSVPLFIKGLTIFRWARGVIELRYGKVFKQWKEGIVSAVSKVILRK